MIEVSRAGLSSAARIPQSATGMSLPRSSFRETSSPREQGKARSVLRPKHTDGMRHPIQA